MGRRPISSDEKTLDGECRANMAGVRTCFSGECPMGLRPISSDENLGQVLVA